MNVPVRHRLLARGITVIFEDESMLVLSKPSGLLVIPDRYDAEAPNVYHLCLKEYGEIFVVHRIDRDTSGILLLARTAVAHGILSRAFEHREIQKSYLAICRGNPTSATGTIELALSESRRDRGKMIVDPKRGKPSLTEYTVQETFRGYALLETRPLTGRTHQLRLHLREIGLPILCDPFYGDGMPFLLSSVKAAYRSKEEERPLLQRTALHAASISLRHPSTGKDMAFTAPIPKDMEAVLKALRKYCPAPVRNG